MPTAYQTLQEALLNTPKTWLVTGVAGFIGSSLLETLLRLDQRVIGLDNFSTGKQGNLHLVEAVVSEVQWQRFRFVEGDIRELEQCRAACAGVDYVLHQAALGSVPRSIDNPIASHESNVDGFLNMLVAARDADVRQLVFASSSSVYGDHPALPKVEENIGQPLSPYSLTKRINEMYAEVFARTYGMRPIGLRYFNVFGRRQNPEGAYAAVIPRWIRSMIAGHTVHINGDGNTSRDFCYIENAIQANLLAATTSRPEATGQVYNVAVGTQTSLAQLFELIASSLKQQGFSADIPPPVYQDFRAGDVRHSLADTSKVTTLLGYLPSHTIAQGMWDTVAWYLEQH